MSIQKDLEGEGFRFHFPREFNEGIKKIRMDYCDYPMKAQKCKLDDCEGKENCRKYQQYKEEK